MDASGNLDYRRRPETRATRQNLNADTRTADRVSAANVSRPVSDAFMMTSRALRKRTS